MYIFNIIILFFLIFAFNVQARELSTSEKNFLNNELQEHLDKNKFLAAKRINGYYRENFRDSLNSFADIINSFYIMEPLNYTKERFSFKSVRCENNAVFEPNTIPCIAVNLPFINSQITEETTAHFRFTYPVYGKDAYVVNFDYNSFEPLTKTDILLNNYTYGIVSFYKQTLDKAHRNQESIINEIALKDNSYKLYNMLDSFEKTLSMAGTKLNTTDNVIYVVSIGGRAEQSLERSKISMILNKVKDNGDFNKDLYILVDVVADGY
ncbi:MAG: hypothetical protein LBQ34_05715 [Alphaproteobacteria bacterium]|jgi:hypothetical protein|nr:hypothetical protein [Alphaproteobacteria bacterium]